jgi:histidinol-phosphate aminotransferase
MDKQLRVDIYSLLRNVEGRCPVVFLRTFSKAYGLAGLRIGYGLMARELAVCLDKVRQPFNINHMAQVGALVALEDEEYYQRILHLTRDGLDTLRQGVEQLGCHAYPSQTNFFLIDVRGDADRLYQAMLVKGVIIRSMSAYGLSNLIRVTVGTDVENKRFLMTLSDCLTELAYV